ncbi:hypothetical protein E2562_012497 [Oryza meyeriana var. granulata]|uniref:Uncharacterized protein n=1 Tax=Oryza meyeriana var. granulata TaxID=110450 RepID=A0A6G1BUK3_9ORYZ|nr:hypothetical protein E2562_012497 [Oryza meyeriana var. granulata]
MPSPKLLASSSSQHTVVQLIEFVTADGNFIGYKVLWLELKGCLQLNQLLAAEQIKLKSRKFCTLTNTN